MTTANTPAPKEVAALLVIGDRILTGRTKDKNTGYVAEYLIALGIDLRSCRRCLIGWRLSSRLALACSRKPCARMRARAISVLVREIVESLGPDPSDLPGKKAALDRDR
jgi:hypothetical protein